MVPVLFSCMFIGTYVLFCSETLHFLCLWRLFMHIWWGLSEICFPISLGSNGTACVMFLMISRHFTVIGNTIVNIRGVLPTVCVCVIVCHHVTSRMRQPRPALGCCVRGKKCNFSCPHPVFLFSEALLGLKSSCGSQTNKILWNAFVLI
jgi:hypothetical protein